MQAPADPNIATCPDCGALLDVSEEQLFSLINCSGCGAQMRVRCDFANFEIHGVLGVGGQGIVYRALDKKLNRPVAIKVMKREFSEDPDFVKRFESEARITASLNHPNIVKVFSFGEHDGLVYLAMEVVDHGSLESLMVAAGKVPEDRVLEVAIQIAQALKAGLALGLIHRDLKPGNILFADEHTAKIVDFGLAILVEKQHEEQGDVWATPYYVAPEKLDGRTEDFRSDMYSLAATLFHALAGRPPFLAESNSIEELRKIKSRPVRLHTFAPQSSDATTYTIDRALAAEPDERFPNYDEFIQNLEYAREELRKHSGPRQRTRPLVAEPPKQPRNWAALVTIAAVVGAGLYFWFNRGQPGGDRDSRKAAPNAAQTFASAEERYNQGRKEFIEGMFADASKNFRVLFEDGSLQEPKNSWAGVHLGLAEYFAGHPENARAAFTRLTERIVPSTIGLDAKLITFLHRLSEIGTGKAFLTPEWMAQFDPTTYEAIAPLLGAVREWEAGVFDDAAVLFRQFQKTSPVGDSAWINDYRHLVTRYLDDYGRYREIADAIRNVDAAPQAAETALKRIPDTMTKVRSSGLRQKLTELELASASKIASVIETAKTTAARKKAEAEALDAKTLEISKRTAKRLCEDYRFAEAATTIRATGVKGEGAVAERELLAKRIDWLAQFKRQLIEDLNTGGCTLPLQRKTGQQIVGGIARATDTQLDVRVQFGSLPVAWTDLSPQSLLQMARFHMRPTLPAPALADRKWLAGVFCLFAQITADGWALMDEAALKKEEYRTQAAVFFGRQNPATQPPTPDASPPVTEQPLNPSRKDPNEDIIKGIRGPS